MVIIEGIDNSGKSTLGRYISDATGLPVIESVGKPKGQVALMERVANYLDMKDHIVVRHPVVSEDIYGPVNHDISWVHSTQRDFFYQQHHLFIYCDPVNRRLDAHVLKPHDTEEHINKVFMNYDDLLYKYRLWAMEHAHIIYRIGDTHLYDIMRAARRHAGLP